MATVHVSLGEALDRLSILELKLLHNPPPTVREEYASLRQQLEPMQPHKLFYLQMKSINHTLWQLEDRMARLETAGSDADVACVGRSIMKTNRARSQHKKDINLSVGAAVEFKLYGGNGCTQK